MENDRMKNPILKIKNFGPIGENPDKYFEDGEETHGFFKVEFAPVTVFIGPQASGKSTITKLYSTFAWFEKALVQGKEDKDDFNNFNLTPHNFSFSYRDDGINKKKKIVPFENKLVPVINGNKLFYLFKNQGIETYLTENSEIQYEGTFYRFKVEKKDITLSDEYGNPTQNIYKGYIYDITIDRSVSKPNDYFCPKLIYIPADRNISSINIDKLAGVIQVFKIFQNTYEEAKEKLREIQLPIKTLKARYYPDSFKTVIINENNSETDVKVSSSGCQSITPLSFISKYLTDKTKTFDFKESVRNSSIIMHKKVKELANKDEYEIFDELIKSLDEKKFADEIRNLEEKYSYLFNRCFINIVEEPEQNLFPETQADLLYELLACKNANEHNKLIFSTHSPYLLTSLNNAIYAEEVYKKTGKEIPEFPKEKRIAYENVSAYKCENGGIFSINDEETQLINADAIDDCSIKTSEDFDKLQDLEAEYERNKN